MASFTSNNTFELSFADVPLLLDFARVIRLRQPVAEQEDPHNLAPLKHQPAEDIIDELNRMLPSMYLQDFDLPSDYPGRNLGGIARQEKIGPQPNPSLTINSFYYPNTASRWGVFRGLATSSAVKAMLAAVQVGSTLGTGGGSSTPLWLPKTFTMKAAPTSPDNPSGDPTDYTVETPMYLLPPRPLAEHGSQFDGLYLITLVDERFYFQGTPVLLHPNKDTTWASLIAELASVLGIGITYSAIPTAYSQPEPDSPLWANFEQAPTLLDAIAYNLGRMVVRNLDGTYSLLTAGESGVVVDDNRGTVTDLVRVAGGDIFNDASPKGGDLRVSRNAIVPKEVVVTFPYYVYGDSPVPHFLNSRYANQRPSAWYEDSYGSTYDIAIPISQGGPTVAALAGTSDHTIHDTAKALIAVESQTVPDNTTALASLALQIAKDFYSYRAVTALDEVYPGTYAWDPEGFHDIVWTYSARTQRACTRVMRTQWNQAVAEMQHAAPPLDAKHTIIPKGVGGPSVAQTWVDSESILSSLSTGGGGSPTVALAGSLSATALYATVTAIDYLPTQNRWRGQIGDEIILFEGTTGGYYLGQVTLTATGSLPANQGGTATLTGVLVPTADASLSGGQVTLTTASLLDGGIFVPSGTLISQGDTLPFAGTLINNTGSSLMGGTLINNTGGSQAAGGTLLLRIVYRGIDGTVATAHNAGAAVLQLTPSTAYGVNLVRHEKMQFTYPSEWTSGGIQGVNVVPQIQSVFVLDDVGKLINNTRHFSGQVDIYDPTLTGQLQWIGQEYVWAIERNGSTLAKNTRLDGQLVGYSANPAAPVYAVDAGGGSSTPNCFAANGLVVIGNTTASMPDQTQSQCSLTSQPVLANVDTLNFDACSFVVMPGAGTGAGNCPGFFEADIKTRGLTVTIAYLDPSCRIRFLMYRDGMLQGMG